MTEYVDREAAYEAIMSEPPDAHYPHWYADKIKAIPAADVEPVRHGRWEPVLEGVWNLPTPVLVGWRCSQCGRTEQEKEPYCNCGAKMDLEV